MKTWIKITTVLFLLLSLMGCSDSKINEANHFYENGQYTEAIPLYTAAVEKKTKNIEVYQNLLDCYYQTQQLENMNQLYQTIKDRNLEQRLAEKAPAPPDVTVAPGTYDKEIQLAFQNLDAGQIVLYETNGKRPTYASAVFSEPIPLSYGEYSINAVTYDHGVMSDPVTFRYTVKPSIDFIRSSASLIQGDRMYFASKGLAQIDLKGENFKILSIEVPLQMAILGNDLFFSTQQGLYKMDLATQEQTLITNQVQSSSPFFITQNCIFYESEGQINSVGLSGEDANNYQGKSDLYLATSKYLFYGRSDNESVSENMFKLYQTDLEKGETKVIFKKDDVPGPPTFGAVIDGYGYLQFWWDRTFVKFSCDGKDAATVIDYNRAMEDLKVSDTYTSADGKSITIDRPFALHGESRDMKALYYYCPEIYSLQGYMADYAYNDGKIYYIWAYNEEFVVAAYCYFLFEYDIATGTNKYICDMPPMENYSYDPSQWDSGSPHCSFQQGSMVADGTLYFFGGQIKLDGTSYVNYDLKTGEKFVADIEPDLWKKPYLDFILHTDFNKEDMACGVVDLNEDGIPELFLKDSDGFAVYGVVDGAVKQLIYKPAIVTMDVEVRFYPNQKILQVYCLPLMGGGSGFSGLHLLKIDGNTIPKNYSRITVERVPEYYEGDNPSTEDVFENIRASLDNENSKLIPLQSFDYKMSIWDELLKQMD